MLQNKQTATGNHLKYIPVLDRSQWNLEMVGRNKSTEYIFLSIVSAQMFMGGLVLGRLALYFREVGYLYPIAGFI